MQKWKFPILVAVSMLLLIENVKADAYATLKVKFVTVLEEIGQGIGNMFLNMSPSLAIFLILLAVGSMVGYILSAIARRAGMGGDEGYQRPA